MNINEAIELVKDTSYSVPINSSVKYLREDTVINIISQIDTQPKPVIVPEFVADWYEKHKASLDYNLYLYLISLYDEKSEKNAFYYWMQKTKNPIQILINMHQFGYEVEKEQLYVVEIPMEDK